MSKLNLVCALLFVSVLFFLVLVGFLVSGRLVFVDRGGVSGDFNERSGYKLFMSDSVKEELAGFYNRDFEYSVCLNGRYNNYVFNVTDVWQYTKGTGSNVSGCDLLFWFSSGCEYCFE